MREGTASSLRHEDDVPSSNGSAEARTGGCLEEIQSSDSNQEEDIFKARELEIRKKTKHNTFYLVLINGYSAAMIFALRLISIEALFGIFLSVGLTCYAYFATQDNLTFDGNAMSWVLLSFAVVTPMSASIVIAFRRRERAVANIARLRATLLGLYGAHAVWDWKNKKDPGRAGSIRDWLKHVDAALVELLGIGDEMSQLLSLPNACRARNRLTKTGREEAIAVLNLGDDLFYSILKRVGRISLLCEVLKEEGLPPNEATRIRQWERIILEELQQLRMIKYYRTPQALRSFARLFSVFLPPFYAPYYAQLARDLNSLAAGIIFAILTSVALTSLFEAINQIEDPFVAHLTLDGIDVNQEFQVKNRRELLCIRDNVFFVSAPPLTLRQESRHETPSAARIFEDSQ